MYYLYSQKREIDESFYFHMDEDLQEVLKLEFRIKVSARLAELHLLLIKQ